ncbi:uncharacterized protein LOC142587470 [Dermacentor variabilis]|uniref:uncharacterized protein LOC142587470 n=1 Tax=Dermacentor variabilis TaxID=34621 RepID=UPI003F5B4FFD
MGINYSKQMPSLAYVLTHPYYSHVEKHLMASPHQDQTFDMSAKENRGGGQTCSVPGCSNNTRKDENISFHGFPKDNKLKQEWVRRINRQGSEGRFTLWKPSKHHKICGAHFNTSGRKGYTDRLPTIFPHRVYAERTPAVVTGAGKRRRIKRVVAMLQEAYIQDELCICGTVDVESQQHNLSATSPVLLPAASPSSIHPQLLAAQRILTTRLCPLYSGLTKRTTRICGPTKPKFCCWLVSSAHVELARTCSHLAQIKRLNLFTKDEALT